MIGTCRERFQRSRCKDSRHRIISETQIEALQAELDASRLLQEQLEAQNEKLLELEQTLAQRETQSSLAQEVSCLFSAVLCPSCAGEICTSYLSEILDYVVAGTMRRRRGVGRGET